MKKLMKKSMNKKTINSFINYAIVLVFFVIVQNAINQGSISSSLKGQMIPICTYIVMALSLNLLVGISGELSLGHAGFMSVGAFSGVIVATCMQNMIASPSIRLVLSIAVGALIAAVFGLLVGIPVLRLRGDYLAIVTLAFGEIIKNIFNCLYIGFDSHGLHFSLKDAASLNMEVDGITIINGPMGALGIKKISTFFGGIVLILVVLFIIQNLVNSRSGRAIEAIRDNQIAAEACGLNITKYKLMAFVTSAAMAGSAGALYALNYSTVVPKKFDFNTSILVLVFVVLGGIGNLRGSIIAAAVLTVLPELLREFQDYRMLVYAIVLILVMLGTNNPKLQGFFKGIGTKLSKKASAMKSK